MEGAIDGADHDSAQVDGHANGAVASGDQLPYNLENISEDGMKFARYRFAAVRDDEVLDSCHMCSLCATRITPYCAWVHMKLCLYAARPRG